MIEHDRKLHEMSIECDSCGKSVVEYDVFDEDDGFTTLWNAWKADGWQARKIGVDWTHKCPKCAGERSAKQMFGDRK